MNDQAVQGAKSELDPATFEVVKNSLYSIAEEMRVVLAKTAYSPILKLAGDYSCGVFDIAGQMVAQGPDLPIHLGSMPEAVQAVIKAYDQIVPGDVFIHNDPYFGGSHLPDVNVVTPAFVQDRLIGYACIRAHWPDIGSATPGSYGAVTEIFGEGLRLPPIRLYAAGEPIREVEDIIFANVRTPDERRGDLSAQVAANRRAVNRLSVLAERYGTDLLARIMTEVMDYSERMMRKALQDLPDGEGQFEEQCDGDGIIAAGDTTDQPFTVRMSVKKQGDHLTVDLTKSDPAVPGPMNAPHAVTASGIFTAVKTMADPNTLIPPNSGCWRPVQVVTKPGTVVHAEHPSPVVYANHEMSHRVCDMLFGAMASFVPDRVMACSQGTSAILTVGGVDYRTEKPYVSYETIKGGFGARPNQDGINAVSSGISNTMNTPIELLEMSFPFRIERYELRADSGGAGRYRGGLGARRVWKILERDAHIAVCCERALAAPFGLFGAAAGAPMRLVLKTPDGREQVLNSKGSFMAPAGSEIWFDVPGSGGYGDRRERDPVQIAADLKNGYISEAAASSDYGVTITDLPQPS